MRLLKLLQRPKAPTEIIRCQIPATLPFTKKKGLIRDLIALQMNLIGNDPIYLELEYRGEYWRFSLNDTHAISFNGDCIWVPDNDKEILVPFHIHYITSIWCITIVD